MAQANMLDMSLDDLMKESRDNRMRDNVGGGKGEKIQKLSAGKQTARKGLRQKRGPLVAMPRTQNQTRIGRPDAGMAAFKRVGRRGQIAGRMNKPVIIKRFTGFDGQPRNRGRFQFQNRQFASPQGISPIPRPTNRGRDVVKISNLDYSVMEEDLMDLFSQVGEVVKVWVDYDHTDRSKGTGGCIFKDSKSAQSAVQLLKGSLIDNMPVHVELLSRESNYPRGPRNCPW